jgi:nucleotide-binding universal stress UspA family protein
MVGPIRTLVVGVAAIEGDTVLPAAVQLAWRLSATLHVVHGYEVPHPILAAYGRLGMREAAVHELYGTKVRARLLAEIRRLNPDISVTVHAAAGEGGRMLGEMLRKIDAELIVLGATRRGVLMNQLLGSTADQVIRGARAPVLVLRPPFESFFRRVLLTTDVSAASGAAVDRALELVDQISAGESQERSLLMVVSASGSTRRESTEAALNELIGFAAKRPTLAVPLQSRVRFGDPAHEVLAEVTETGADLVVVGTRGRTGVSRYFLGSVAASIVRGTTTSVLVIPFSVLPAQGARSVETEASARDASSSTLQ